MEKHVFELDDIVAGLEDAQGVLLLMVDELNQEYFDYVDEWAIKHEHERAAKKAKVALKYAIEVTGQIGKIREIINVEVAKDAAATSI